MRSPSERQQLGCRIRAAQEAFIKDHRTPCGGGWSVPDRDIVYEHLSKLFGIPKAEVGYFMTYSRYCTHPWDAGACIKCPE